MFGIAYMVQYSEAANLQREAIYGDGDWDELAHTESSGRDIDKCCALLLSAMLKRMSVVAPPDKYTPQNIRVVKVNNKHMKMWVCDHNLTVAIRPKYSIKVKTRMVVWDR